MGRLQNPESQKQYARYWKQFLCYCLRIVVAEEEEGVVDAPGRGNGSPAHGTDGDAGGRDTGHEDAGQIRGGGDDGDGVDDDEDDEDDDDSCGSEAGTGTDKDNAKFLWDAYALF